MISLDIISDPICPWCYIGKARLDAATRALDATPFELSWRIFQLNPTMPAEGMDRRAYLEWKFGGPEQADRIYGEIDRVATASGLSLNLDGIGRTPNTFDAHRLIRWARTTGAQTAVVDELFKRYFEKGEDIGDRDLLLDVGESVGMERELVARLFDSDADTADLQEEEALARQMGVTGVPTFILGERYVLTGAQETETWTKVVDELTQTPISATQTGV
jgi:predicted DsbA family dithiol-disulfide isomerase